MSDRGLYLGVAVLAVAAGATFWMLGREAGPPRPAAATIGPAALYATTFTSATGETLALGRFQGQVLLVNFWATWCAPCREEMPALSAAAKRWRPRGVTIVGLSNELVETVGAFSRDAPVDYVVGTAGTATDELAKRLGDQAGVLPYSAVIGPGGRVISQKVGPYSQAELDAALQKATTKDR